MSGSAASRPHPDELIHVIDEATGNFVERLRRPCAGRQLRPRSIQWLQSFGTTFVPMEPTDGWKDYVLPPLGFHDKTTMEWEGLGADRLIDRLEQRTKELGGDSIRGVKGYRTDHGEWAPSAGVTAETADGRKSYRAKAVVLADGGFESNKDMLRRFITPHPENLHIRAPESGNGDGMRLAEDAGGMLIGMEAFYGHVLSADCLRREGLSPFPFLEFLAATGMMVDFNCERFVDETKAGHFTSNALARHGNGLAFVIFDDAMWNSIGRHFFCPPNPNLVNAGGTLHKAGDIETLARKINLDPKRLRELVDAQNRKVEANRAEDQRLAAARAAMPSYGEGQAPVPGVQYRLRSMQLRPALP